ncbi:MAG: hypothetical protein KDC53_22490 [Saprospiraceae bacterium]|nr:hypothetical protein [Saprospiraceae bacterium]
MSEINWARLYSSPSEVLIAILKGKLHENQIAAVELSKKDTVYNVFGEIELMVPQDLFTEALDVLADFKEEIAAEEDNSD